MQATFPLDVAKTRMQSVSWSAGDSERKRPSLRWVAVDAVRSEGWRVMFAGLGPTLIRCVARGFEGGTSLMICRSASCRHPRPGPVLSR